MTFFFIFYNDQSFDTIVSVSSVLKRNTKYSAEQKQLFLQTTQAQLLSVDSVVKLLIFFVNQESKELRFTCPTTGHVQHACLKKKGSLTSTKIRDSVWPWDLCTVIAYVGRRGNCLRLICNLVLPNGMEKLILGIR